MKRTSRAVALVTMTGIAIASVYGQQRGPAGRGESPTASKRGNRQIGSSAANILGLKVGFRAGDFGPLSFSEAAASVDALGTGFIEGSSTQKVSPEIPKNLDYDLSPEELAKVKHRLSELRLGMQAYRVDTIPAGESARRKLFGFAKSLGVETIVTRASTEAVAEIERLADEFKVNVAFESSNPGNLMRALEGRGKRIGVSLDTGSWMQAGISPVDGLKLVNDRLLSITLKDRSAIGGGGREVELGSGALGMEQFFLALAKLAPPGTPPLPTCGDCAGPRVPVKPLFVAIGGGRAENPPDKFAQCGRALEKATRTAEGYQIVQISKKTPISFAADIPLLDRKMIEAAAPQQALVKPKKARKLLIVDLCPQGGFYHRTVPHANLAVELMAKNTGAFEAIFNNDLDNLKYPKIKEYDAVFLNSVVGPVFADPDVINGLMRFVREGGGVAGIHGSTYASNDVAEYGEMMGAQTGPHRIEAATLKMDDPSSPLTKQFEGNDVDHVDEFYHFLPAGPYTREKLHVLMSVNTAKSPVTLPAQAVRPDNDYAMTWIRSYGGGRVFNTALGHTPLLFATPRMAQMVFAGIQFVLGDLEADTTPSAKLSVKK